MKYALTFTQKVALNKQGYVNIQRNGKQVKVTPSMAYEQLDHFEIERMKNLLGIPLPSKYPVPSEEISLSKMPKKTKLKGLDVLFWSTHIDEIEFVRNVLTKNKIKFKVVQEPGEGILMVLAIYVPCVPPRVYNKAYDVIYNKLDELLVSCMPKLR